MDGYRYRVDIIPHRVTATITHLPRRFYLRCDGFGGDGRDERRVAGGEKACGGEAHRGGMGLSDRSCTTALVGGVSHRDESGSGIAVAWRGVAE